MRLNFQAPIRFLTPEIDEAMAVPTHILYETVEDAISQYPHAKGIVLTYPNYYGHAVDLKPIIEKAHQHDIPVLVDEAHGAHFVLGHPFPQSSLKAGADAVVQSAHKTLPAMTMGSYLHLNSGRINRDRLAYYLSVLQSSSPSYPIMASLDIARAYAEDILKTNRTADIEKELINMREVFSQINGADIVEPADARIRQDPLKLCIRSAYGHSGFELKSIFEANGIHPELADERQVLLILPLEGKNMPAPELISTISKDMKDTAVRNDLPAGIGIPSEKSRLCLTGKASCLPSKRIGAFTEAAGRISAESVTPYPPGIPLIMAGERITKETISRLTRLVDLNVHIQGSNQLKQKQLTVYIEEEKS